MGITIAERPRTNIALLCALPLLASACSGAHEAEAPGGSRLELPMIPVESAPLGGVLQFDQSARVIRLDEYIALAMGDGYPTEFVSELHTGSEWLCSGAIKEEGASLRLERAEVAPGSAATVTLEDGGALRIGVREAGQTDVRILGTFDPAGWVPYCYENQMTGEPIPAEIQLRIVTIPVVGMTLLRLGGPPVSGCNADTGLPYSVATSSLPGLTPAPTDARGERFFPSNAAGGRALSVMVVAERGRPLEAPDEDAGLAALRFPDAPGPVHIEPAFGQRRTISVVDDSAITELDVQMLLVGSSRTPIPLHDGDTKRLGSSIFIRPNVASAYVGERRLCSTADPTWFELSSDTSDRCKVERTEKFPFSDQGDLDMQVRPVALGECAIRLRAPGIDNGDGFERRLSVTFSEN